MPSEAAEPILSVAELLAKTEAAYAAITTHHPSTYHPPPTSHLLSPTYRLPPPTTHRPPTRYAAFALSHAAELAMEALFATNKYVTDTEPWHLPAGDVRRSVLVRTVLEVLYISP